MVLPHSGGVPRVPPYSGTAGSFIAFEYRAITVYGRAFQLVLLANQFLTPQWRPTPPSSVDDGFGLFPVRSPLLGESLLLSFPEGTEMVQFPSLASLSGWSVIKPTGLPHSEIPGSKLVQQLSGTYRSYTTSFIAS